MGACVVFADVLRLEALAIWPIPGDCGTDGSRSACLETARIDAARFASPGNQNPKMLVATVLVLDASGATFLT
jgi:hypothetical protein